MRRDRRNVPPPSVYKHFRQLPLPPERENPILDTVADWAKLACFVVVGFVCLPAHAEVYRVQLPPGAEHVEWSAGGVGWDVEVSYDPNSCELSCTYRRSHNALGEMPLLPPVTIVRFHTGPKESTITRIDPAGVASPTLAVLPAGAGQDCSESKWAAVPSVQPQAAVWGAASRRPIRECAERYRAPLITLRI